MRRHVVERKRNRKRQRIQDQHLRQCNASVASGRHRWLLQWPGAPRWRCRQLVAQQRELSVNKGNCLSGCSSRGRRLILAPPPRTRPVWPALAPPVRTSRPVPQYGTPPPPPRPGHKIHPTPAPCNTPHPPSVSRTAPHRREENRDRDEERAPRAIQLSRQCAQREEAAVQP